MGLPSRTIGPYTLEKRLGAGGMGEVYRAYDRRLDRWVALKLIRSEAAEDRTARERFRREARAAARLSHPAIVQIHDIIESDKSEESDAIVMELVEGESLASRIDRGPLPVGEVVRIGREIVEGLAAAHAKGLIHRDLKPENVMLTPDGRAKILDFGLAKRLEGEASLTEDHRILGTFRSMSPEQARGWPVDVRSDLFSLGTLLYEMLSGTSPFEGSSALDTLTRICTHRQKPLSEIDPGIPAGLSAFVDQLLQKEPGHRPQTARKAALALETALAGDATVADTRWEAPPRLELPPTLVGPPPDRMQLSQSYTAPKPAFRWAVITALLVILAAVFLWRWVGRPGAVASRVLPAPEPAPVYVAVVAPRLGAGAELPGVGLLAAGLRGALLQGLLAFEGAFPIAPEQVDAVQGSPTEIARATAAGEVLLSRLDCNAINCQVVLDRVRGNDGTLLWEQSFSVPVDQPYLLREAVLGYLKQGFAGRRMQQAKVPSVAPADYTEFLRLYKSFDTHREEEMRAAEILSAVEGIRARSPEFIDAYMLEVYVLQQRFRSRRDPSDLDRAFQVLADARRIAPNDPRPLFSLFEVAFLGEQLDKAQAALDELDRIQPGDARVIAQKARLLDRRGRSAEASRLIAAAIRLSPSWKHLFWAADMEYRQGKVPQARAHLEELLRRSPGNFTGQSLLAQLELLYGRPERAADLYADLVRRAPALDEISNLGLAYFLLGRFREAEESYRRAYELQPRNPFVVLNLADVCLLEKRRPEAEKLYQQVLRLVAQDPTAASNWQMHSARAQALAHLGRTREAVEAVQQVLRLAADNSQATWEVSLVYALLGDRASAVFNAGKAIEQGVEPRWFLFPWFDSLREDAEFRKLLSSPRKTAAS